MHHPLYIFIQGYGFIWNNPAIGRAEFVNNHTMWHVQCAKQIDYVVIAGDTPGEINEKFTAVTGRAPMLPEWAAGFWQCKLRYETQEELLQVAREYKKRGLPISVIVIDYFHWTMQENGSLILRNGLIPRPWSVSWSPWASN